jgi:hypothetical protein
MALALLLAAPLAGAWAAPASAAPPDLVGSLQSLDAPFREGVAVGMVAMAKEAGLSPSAQRVFRQETERALQGTSMEQFMELSVTTAMPLNPQGSEAESNSMASLHATFKLDALVALLGGICDAALPRLSPSDQGPGRRLCAR